MTKTKRIACVLTLAIAMCFTVICLSGSTSVSAMAEEVSTATSTSSSNSTATETRTSSVTLYDGSVDNKQMATVTQNDVVMILKGFSNSPKTLTGITANDKAYSYSTPTGGKSSTSRSIQLIIPDTYDSFTVYMVAATNNSTAVNVGISESAEYASTDTKILTTGTEPDSYFFGTSASLEAGTYYVTFDNSIRIAELTVNVTKTVAEGSTTVTDSTNTDDDLIIGNKVTPMTKDRKLKIVFGSVAGVAVVLVLIILLCNCTKKSKRRKCVDYDDFDDYDDYYDEY